MGDRRRGFGNARRRRLRGVEPAVRDAGRPRREGEGVRAAREVAGRRRGGGPRANGLCRARAEHKHKRTCSSFIELAHERISVCSAGSVQLGRLAPGAQPAAPNHRRSRRVTMCVPPPRDFSRPVAVARAPASFATPPRGFPARAPLRERSARAILGQSGRDAGCANDHPPGVRSPRSRPRPPGRRPARAPRVRARAGTLARRRSPRRPPRGPRRSRRKYLLPPMRLGRATPRSPWSARRSRRDRSPAPATPSPRVPARRTTRKEPHSRRTRPPHL